MNEEQSEIKVEDLQPVKSEGIDLKKFHNEQVVIEGHKIIRVPSKFTPKNESGEHLKQWVLKVFSPVLISIGEGDELIEFRASELFNLIQDKEGKLIGYPENPESNLCKFMKDINAETPKDILEKKATVKAYDKEVEDQTRTYLKFKY